VPPALPLLLQAAARPQHADSSPALRPALPACGLYYLAELCEEYVITAKRIIGHTIKAGAWRGQDWQRWRQRAGASVLCCESS
jgi:hypothetical protein